MTDKAVSTRTITVYLNGGKRRRVENIPADAKITYGPVQPGRGFDHPGQNALRIYTSKENQLAVFVGVTEFRDDSLKVLEEKVVTKAKNKGESGPNGERHENERETTVSWEESK